MSTIEKYVILRAFRLFGLSMFSILILKVIRLILVLSLSLVIDTDIFDFIFGTITVILVLLTCLNFSRIPKIDVNKEFRSFWLAFLFAHLIEYLLITLTAFVYPTITSTEVAFAFSTFGFLFYLVIGIIYFQSNYALKSYFEIKQVKFGESRKNDATSGVRYLAITFLLYFLGFLIITFVIGVILEYVAYYILGKFRTLSIESEQIRIKNEEKRRIEVEKRLDIIRSKIIGIGYSSPELTVQQLSSKIDYNDRVFLRANNKPLREFVKDLILKGEINAVFMVETDTIIFSN